MPESVRLAVLSMEDAAASLARGGILAYPTEGVWGLGCDPFDEAAVLRLLALKQRSVDKGLILVASSRAHFDGVCRRLDDAGIAYRLNPRPRSAAQQRGHDPCPTSPAS